MARRSTNRVPLIKGPTGADSTPKEKVLARRVAQLEQSTGAVEFSGQDELSTVVVEGGTSTTVNNVYNITTGGGAGTVVVIGGTGEVASGIAGLPSTIEPRGFYGHAVGASLRSTLTSAGHGLQGVYSDYGYSFRPIDSLSTAYGTVSSVPSSSSYPPSRAQGSAMTPDFSIPTFDAGDDQGDYGSWAYDASSGSSLIIDGFTVSIVDDVGATTLIAEVGDWTSTSSARALYLGDSRSSGEAYFLTYHVDAGNFGSRRTKSFQVGSNSYSLRTGDAMLYTVDLAGLVAAYSSGGFVPYNSASLDPLVSVVGTDVNSLWANFPVSSTGVGYYLRTPRFVSTTRWAGALTGQSRSVLANIYQQNGSPNLPLIIDLNTAAIAVGSSYLGAKFEDALGMPILIKSPMWGNSTVDEWLGVHELPDGSGGTEYRVTRFGAWGYVDITPIGSGVASTNDVNPPGVVPLSDSATMFSGGAPTHATWYHTFDGGTVYVDLSTL